MTVSDRHRKGQTALLIQRLKICLRLGQTLLALLMSGEVLIGDLFKIQKKGNGLASTFIIGKCAVIKIRNELASAGNRSLYNGKFDGLFFYASDLERQRNEFEFYNLLYKQGMTARPLRLTKNAVVTSYIDAQTISDLPPDRLAQIFDLIDRIHQLKIFHGDFNLNNFLWQKDKIFIVDFESSRFVQDGEGDTLYALDTLIFIEKLHRFHKTIFLALTPALRSELEKRTSTCNHTRELAHKYLAEDIYNAIFG